MKITKAKLTVAATVLGIVLSGSSLAGNGKRFDYQSMDVTSPSASQFDEAVGNPDGQTNWSSRHRRRF